MTILLESINDKATKVNCKPISPEEICTKLSNVERSVSFFVGAGFSKAWDESYPLGNDLFSIKKISTLKRKYNFFKVAEDLRIIEPAPRSKEYSKDCYNYFKEIKFHLDIFKRYPSLMPNYLDSTLIIALEKEMKSFIKSRFIETVGEKELELKSTSDKNHRFIPFFDKLLKIGVKTSFVTTNYDFIIEKILINMSMDIHLNKGVIDQAKFDSKEWHKVKVDLFKINGGFEVFKDPSGLFYLDYNEKEKSPNIILPSPEQNYDDKYFKSVFVKSANKLRESNTLVFIGYSLPVEDHTISFLLKNFTDTHREDKEVIIIGRSLSSAQSIHEKASKLFPSIHEKDGIYSCDGSFDDVIEKFNITN